MPYAVAGHCFATAGEALESFQKAFPLLGDVNWTGHVSSSITPTGLVSYSVLTRPITSNTVFSRTGTFQLSSCSEPDLSPFDPVVGGAVFALFFVSVLGIYLLSQSIGLILEAIKKWGSSRNSVGEFA